MTKKRLLPLLLIALLLLMPSTANASGIPVVDILAWIQRFSLIYNQYEQIAAQYQHIRVAIAEAQAAVKQLEAYRDGHYSDLNGLLGAVDQIFNSYSQIESNLGYLRIGVEDIYRQTFPGTEVFSANPNVDVPASYVQRVGRVNETLALLFKGLNRMTWNNTHSQVELAEFSAASQAADTALKASQANGMLTSLGVTEQQKTLQATMMTANAVAMGVAMQVQDQATAQAARTRWLASQTPPAPVGFDPSPSGYTGLPSSASASLFF
jgi:P-type conjugative transfer protein TrbJ